MGKNLKKLVSLGIAAAIVSGSISSNSILATEKNIVSNTFLTLDEMRQLDITEHLNSELVNVDEVNAGEKFEDDNSKIIEEYKAEDMVTFIVEVNGKAVVDYLHKGATREELVALSNDVSLMNQVLESQEDAIREAKAVASSDEVYRRYSTLINGFSIKTEYRNYEELKKIPGVKSVTVAERFVTDMKTAKDMTADIESLWTNYGFDGEGMVVSIIDTGLDYEHQDMVLSEDTVERLTQEKVNEIKGTLAGSEGRYFSEKVPYGFNYTADSYAGNGTQDIRHNNNTSPHGTHVGGIVGANCTDPNREAANNGIKGVAPEVQLLGMKVFSNNPTNPYASSADVIAAIEDSVKLGADVINMSLGSTAGFQSAEGTPHTRAIENAVRNGVMVVVSAGNETYSTAPYMIDRVKDTGLIGSPGLVNEALQVASFENVNMISEGLRAKINGTEEVMGFIATENSRPLYILGSGEYDIVDCGTGEKSDFTGKNLIGKIALIKRGGNANFAQKQENAQNAGAKAVIVYNHEEGGEGLITMAEYTGLRIPAMFIGNSSGKKLVENEGSKVFFNGDLISVPSVNEGLMSSFTSWGPTPNLDFKPEITGVGGNIWSTVGNNRYTNMSGTSMSSPYVAGYIALYMEAIKEAGMVFANSEEKAKFIKANSINTAEPIYENTPLGEVIPVSPRRQGAGMINVQGMLNNNVTATYEDEATIALGEISNVVNIPITLRNYGSESVYYVPELMDGAVYSQQEAMLEYEGMMFDQRIEGATVSFQYEPVTVGANSESENNGVETTTGSAVTVNGSLINSESNEVETTTGGAITVNDSLIDLYEAAAAGAIEVKPGEVKVLQATLTVPENTKVDKFVEGFIRFKPTKAGQEEIGIPFMGFYGDWGALPMFDPPVYEEDNLFGFTQLATVDQGRLMIFKDPSYYVMNPQNEKMVNDIVPIISLYRNARYINVEIQNENGETVRSLDTGEFLRKTFSESKNKYMTYLEWLWDGKDDSGTFAEDGNYEVVIKGKVDFEGATWQELRMPIAIDTKAPTAVIKNPVNENYKENNIDVTFSAEDGTTVYAAAVIIKDRVTGETQYVLDELGKIKLYNIENLYNASTNDYTVNVKLPYAQNEIGIILYDKVGNYSVAGVCVVSDSVLEGKVSIVSPENNHVYKADEEVVLEYSYSGSQTVKYEISLIPEGTVEPITTVETTANLGVLPGGEYTVTIKAIDEKGEVLATSKTFFTVEQKGEFIVEDLTGKTSFNKGDQANIKIRVTNKLEKEQEALLIVGLFDSENRMVNVLSVGKTIRVGDVEELSAILNIPDTGEYQLKAFIWDNFESGKPLSNVLKYDVK